MIKSINPYKNNVVFSHIEDTSETIHQKISKLNMNFEIWKSKSNSDRADFLKKISERLRSDIEYLSKVITLEMGKPITESKGEIEKCAWVCDYYADFIESHTAGRIVETEDMTNEIVIEPIGIILGVMPWNFPFWQVFRFIAPNIALGNVCLLKHASNVQQCAKEIEKLIQKCDESITVMSSVIIKSDKVESVITDSRIKGVTLTGSEVAGSQVASIAGKSIKKSVLELGGSDPFIVLKDADIPSAVKNGILGRFLNSGQSCIAAKRFILHKSISKAFLVQFEIEMNALSVGDPVSSFTQIGPLAKQEFVELLEKQVAESIDESTRIIGKRSKDGFYYPTMLIEPKPNSPAYNEEFFGPVAIFFIVNSDEEAISLANRSRFGLSASIWSKNSAYAKEIASKLHSGAVFINSFSKSDPRVPFGGTKSSGYGRELSMEGVLEFANIKTIAIKK